MKNEDLKNRTIDGASRFRHSDRRLRRQKAIPKLFNIHFWRFRKKSFVSDIDQFWRKFYDASGVKNCKLFEGVIPSSCNLARRVMNPKIACGASKFRLFTSSSFFNIQYETV